MTILPPGTAQTILRALGIAEWGGHPRDPSLMPGHYESSPPFTALLGWPLYVGLLLFLVLTLQPEVFDPRIAHLIVAMGAIGIWRWAWQALHFVRAMIYEFIVFPRLRRAADKVPRPPHIYMLVTSYRMAAELNAIVYRRLLEEVVRYRVPATIVACITDPSDAVVIGNVFKRLRHLPEGTRLVFAPQSGTGKRDAMATALKIIAGERPLPDSLVVLMDGDSVLGRGALAKTCSIVAGNPDVGAATTDNIPWVKGGTVAREWYRLRMSHRDNLMCSLSLSRGLLVLTGRFSVFRAEVATAPDFILAVEEDVLPHWRLGAIQMMTGDDKSTWYTVLRRGWKMLYVPDAIIHPVEELPPGRWLGPSIALMLRWYGNMIRNNGRAIALGPRRCGFFLWLSLIDQRISMWTAVYGPTVAITASILYGAKFLHLFLLWILVSRGMASLMLYVSTGRLHPLFPFILYYNQLFGSLLKIYVLFHPHRQRWTRQAIRSNHDEAFRLLQNMTSGLYNALVVLLFIVSVIGLSGILARGTDGITGQRALPFYRDTVTGATVFSQIDDLVTGTRPPGVPP